MNNLSCTWELLLYNNKTTNNIKIIHDSANNQITKINLDRYIENNRTSITIRPHDTVYIKESVASYLFTKVNLVNTILQIANITYTISKLK